MSGLQPTKGPQPSDLAISYLTEQSKEIYRSILKIATELARRDKADTVQKSHIDEARQLLSPKRRGDFWHKIAQVVGGTALGTFLSGFSTSLQIGIGNPDPLWISIYVAIGFVGLFLVVWGFLE